MISIIIPTHNEAAYLPATMDALVARARPCEIIVADGGSKDKTVAVAAARGAIVIECAAKHRAAQLNAGARAAHGEVFLFLHADTILPLNGLERIAAALADREIVGGGFARRYDSPSLLLRLTSLLSEVRCRWSGWFLGDQAIFVRRELFMMLGGFREYEIFEDLDFSRRLARTGRLVTLRPPVVSSARRFATGAWRRTCEDFAMTCRYLCGEHPDAIAARCKAVTGHPRMGVSIS
jgi:rSAM/selenodomain-associated transferase 2